MAALVPAYRVSIFLPVNGPQLIAANDVVACLQVTHRAATFSSTEPVSYSGYWVDEDETVWRDDIAIAFVDLHLERSEVEDALNELRTMAAEVYDAYDCHQELFWITCEAIETLE